MGPCSCASTIRFRNIVDLTCVSRYLVAPCAYSKPSNKKRDCTGHRWQVCVLDKDRNDVVKYLGTIACIEGDESGRVGDWPTKMQNCLTDEERVVVKECFDNRSKELLLEVGGDGSSLYSLLLWLWVISILTFYPPSCVKLIGEQKEFAEEEAAEKEGDAPLAAVGENQAEAKPDVEVQRKEAEKEAAAPVEAEDGDLVVDIKEEPENAAPAEPVNVPVEAAGTGKVKLNMYWRAF
ncbi:hypothetical protein BBJ28_00005454 [Nothophytophthora sp. Chile5]|nr:hypothetical protein BBJ28_00005454 [Nothophytophthora sp. Chile5]